MHLVSYLFPITTFVGLADKPVLGRDITVRVGRMQTLTVLSLYR